MCIDALNWAWLIEKLTPIQKLILIALADHANEEGYCWPGNKSLSVRCNVAVRTIQRNLKVLEDNNLIIVESRERPDGSSTSNGYLLDVPVIANLSPCHAKSITPSTSYETCSDDSGDTPRTINEPPINLHTPNLNLKDLSLDEIPPEVLKSFREGVSSGKIKNKPAYLNTLLSNHIPDQVIDDLLDDKSEISEIYVHDSSESELISEIKHFEKIRGFASGAAKEGFNKIIEGLEVKLSEIKKSS